MSSRPKPRTTNRSRKVQEESSSSESEVNLKSGLNYPQFKEAYVKKYGKTDKKQLKLAWNRYAEVPNEEIPEGLNYPQFANAYMEIYGEVSKEKLKQEWNKYAEVPDTDSESDDDDSEISRDIERQVETGIRGYSGNNVRYSRSTKK